MTPYICVSHALGTKERRCKMYTIILLSFTDFIHRDQNREGLFDIQISLNTPGNRKFMDPPEGKHKILLKANVWSSTWVSVKMLVCPLDDLVWSCHFVIFPMTVWALWKKSAEYEPRRSLWTVMYSCSAVEGIKIRNTESEEDSEPKQSKTALV